VLLPIINSEEPIIASRRDADKWHSSGLHPSRRSYSFVFYTVQGISKYVQKKILARYQAVKNGQEIKILFLKDKLDISRDLLYKRKKIRA